LKECFNSLDDDVSGSIGITELEGPLVGLGFANSRQDIEDMMALVDEDGSGQIEFDEFLQIIKNCHTDKRTAQIHRFFKDMSNGTLGDKNISFSVFV